MDTAPTKSCNEKYTSRARLHSLRGASRETNPSKAVGGELFPLCTYSSICARRETAIPCHARLVSSKSAGGG